MKAGKHLLFLSLILVMLTQVLTAQQAAKTVMMKTPEGVKYVTTVEGISEFQLKNGLRVLLFPDQSKQTATVNITYLVGSRHEGYGETGMAHLLEHLVFKGTPKHPNIPQELTSHGARPNGTTWLDRTNYFETFNATEENLRWALDLEADRMVNSFIAKKDLESEMTVVRNEFESGENDPSSILMERVVSTGYLWHNYGQSTIGARSDIENVPIERLQAFYRKYYQPDNSVLTVAGKFEPEKTLKLIDELFSPIPVPDRAKDPLFKTYTKEPTQDGERSVTLRRVGDVQAVSCMYHTPPGPHAEYAAMAILDEILTSEPAGRLYKALVETKKASTVWSFAPSLAEGGFIYINADVRKENSLDDARTTMLKTLDDILNAPPSKEEVDRAKATILKMWDLTFKNSDRVGTLLSEYIAQGDWRLMFLFRDNIDKVTPEEVVAVAKKYLKPSNRTIGMFIPDEAPDRSDVPDAPDVAMLVKGYTGKAAVAEGEVFDPSQSNIEKRSEKWMIKDDFDLVMLPKETRGDAVTLSMTLRFGELNSLKGKSMAAQFAGSMLDKGTKNYTRQQLKDKMDALKANISVFGGTSSAGVRITTERKNLAEAIELAGEILKNPIFPAEEFEKLREEELAGIESQKSEPQAIASNLMGRVNSPYPKDDPRYVNTFDEEIAEVKKVKLDEVKKFYKDFYGMTDATISVVGDFDKAEIRKLLMDEFGKFDSPKAFKRIPGEYHDIKPVNEKINTPDKANAMFLVNQNIQMRDDDPDYPAMLLGNYMLGGGFLNSRLAVRIRQKEGLSYGVGSFFSASSLDKVGSFGAYAIYAPENLDRLEVAFKEEIAKALKDGFTSEEIEAAKSGWLQGQVIGRSNDGQLAGTLNNNLFIGRDMMWNAELEKKIQALTPEQILAAMQKHVKPEKFTYIKAGDFAKAEKAGKP
jgi:zinc protease